MENQSNQELQSSEASSSDQTMIETTKPNQDSSKNVLTTSSNENNHPQVIIFFKNIFKQDRTIIQYAVNDRYSAKSTFLSLMHKHRDKVNLQLKTTKSGEPHRLIFNTEAFLKSNHYGNVVLKAEAMAFRKKQAESDALFKMANILYH